MSAASRASSAVSTLLRTCVRISAVETASNMSSSSASTSWIDRALPSRSDSMLSDRLRSDALFRWLRKYISTSFSMQRLA